MVRLSAFSQCVFDPSTRYTTQLSPYLSDTNTSDCLIKSHFSHYELKGYYEERCFLGEI